MVNWMKATVFFADILGFSTLARLPRAIPALEALSDVARLLSKDHALAQYLQCPVWHQRYSLSDSIFMVGSEPVAAAAAAAEFFFNLAYYDATQNIPVLMRGALTIGEVRRTRPVFPETAKANLVGEAVVRAVRLENIGVKGPRLMVSKEVADCLKSSSTKWLLDRTSEGPYELLWLLPPEAAVTNGLMIADVARAAIRLALSAASDRDGGAAHYVSYLDLVVRSLLRLKSRFPEVADMVVEKALIRKLAPRLRRAFARHPAIAQDAARRLAGLLR
jgi:hypothetical protein